MKLKVTRARHNRRELVKGKGDQKDGIRTVTYGPGDTFEGTERELKQFSDRLEKVASDPEPAQSDSEMEDLKARADELGVQYATNIGKDTLRKRVEEAEKEAENGSN